MGIFQLPAKNSEPPPLQATLARLGTIKEPSRAITRYIGVMAHLAEVTAEGPKAVDWQQRVANVTVVLDRRWQALSEAERTIVMAADKGT